ncbi:Pyridoxamine 5'-phosphate oxidase-related, FMN-binding [Zostera marina]|uniref:Pyridoxamine 5'-phosphate oxidase-related, FMN-binding n=1 Tax=Zostera marina TaxID=29655 RepID=A0A0K9NX15_ZOSMR|nr:Pyridoxamine 5'-phosphate oxidase-related, FMN-binding [Zostera marina]
MEILPSSIFKLINTKNSASTSFLSSSFFLICQLPMRNRNRAQYMETNTIVYERGPLNFKKCHYDGVRIRCLEFSNEGVGSFEEEEVGYSEIEMISEDKLPSLENQNSSNETSGSHKSETNNPLNYVKSADRGYSSGLFRAPISGGKQSATYCHNLPRPALTVRNLMEQARFAHLCSIMSRSHHRGEGYPFGSLVDFVTDPAGLPIITLSSLAIHTRNLLANRRCSLVVQIPGWSSLSNARVTIFGDIEPLPERFKKWAEMQYKIKHPQFVSQQWECVNFYQLRYISDVYFIGGFGTVTWIDVEEYMNTKPDAIAMNDVQKNLKELNSVFSMKLKKLLSTDKIAVDDAAVISIDSKGIDIKVRQGAQFNIQRVPFETEFPVITLEDAKTVIWKIMEK